VYSVQQLLFDSMSYIKEFGRSGADWHVAVTSADLCGRELGYEVWLHRPALSQRAAETVAACLRSRFGVQPLPNAPELGRFVFLGLSNTNRPTH
jgi:hypothetical protein